MWGMQTSYLVTWHNTSRRCKHWSSMDSKARMIYFFCVIVEDSLISFCPLSQTHSHRLFNLWLEEYNALKCIWMVAWHGCCSDNSCAGGIACFVSQSCCRKHNSVEGLGVWLRTRLMEKLYMFLQVMLGFRPSWSGLETGVRLVIPLVWSSCHFFSHVDSLQDKWRTFFVYLSIPYVDASGMWSHSLQSWALTNAKKTHQYLIFYLVIVSLVGP